MQGRIDLAFAGFQLGDNGLGNVDLGLGRRALASPINCVP